jgi:hypothetical protein
MATAVLSTPYCLLTTPEDVDRYRPMIKTGSLRLTILELIFDSANFSTAIRLKDIKNISFEEISGKKYITIKYRQNTNIKTLFLCPSYKNPAEITSIASILFDKYEQLASEDMQNYYALLEAENDYLEKWFSTLSNLVNIESPLERTLISADSNKKNRQVKILFLASDPTDMARLRLGEELREIQEKIQMSNLRDYFVLCPKMSARPADISQALLDFQPTIVHFSGHGSNDGAICFENELGQSILVEPSIIGSLFETFSPTIQCVILNSCYSEAQALAIAKSIKFVIGMKHAIGDKAAISFAIGFYQAIGAGRTFQEAYRLGCIQIGLHGLNEQSTPVIISNGKLHHFESG